MHQDCYQPKDLLKVKGTSRFKYTGLLQNCLPCFRYGIVKLVAGYRLMAHLHFTCARFKYSKPESSFKHETQLATGNWQPATDSQRFTCTCNRSSLPL
jgi:hypothetical protein